MLFGRIGRILLVIGSVVMVVFAGLFFIINLLTEANFISGIDLDTLNITLTVSTLGTRGWILSSLITFISGLIGVKGYTDLAEEPQKIDLLFTWGVFGIVLGIVGGTIGGGIILIAGIFLMISYFKE